MKLKIGLAHQNLEWIEEIKHALTRAYPCEVIWLAPNKEILLERCQEEQPDILLLDLEIDDDNPGFLIQMIMNTFPCAILLLARNIKSNASLVFEALGYGAMDSIDVSLLHLGQDKVNIQPIIKKIKEFAHWMGKKNSFEPKPPPPSKPEPPSKPARPWKNLPPLLLIGASTGGPLAIAHILSQLPVHLGLAIIIVQHIDERFAPQLAKWLESQCPFSVRQIRNGDQPKKGEVLIAGTNHHLILNSNLELVYTEDPKHNVYRPSIDVFFNSMANFWPIQSMAVLLTGIGNDGAQGLKNLKNKGWYTLAQNEESSVVFGMPKAAIELKGVSAVLSIEEIAPAIVNYASKLPLIG